MKFSDLNFSTNSVISSWCDGVVARHTFPNGYGVSVIRNEYSYGGRDGLYELAVLHNDELCYTTPITDDVIGHLTPERVEEIMLEVSRLAPREED